MTAPADDIGDPLTLIATLRAERDAALAGQSALAEVMDLINRSPGDPAPAFDAVLNAVLRLFDAAFGALHTYDGALVRTVAVRGGAPDATLQGFPIDPGSLMVRQRLDDRSLRARSFTSGTSARTSRFPRQYGRWALGRPWRYP